MGKLNICHDIVRVIYPLYTKKGKVFSGLYTCTCYDIYIHNKIKYVRGKAMFFAEDLSNKSSKYEHISKMPKTIEQCKDYAMHWKFKYNDMVGTIENNTIENYVSHLWLTGNL